jgi:hypothetical protein
MPPRSPLRKARRLSKAVDFPRGATINGNWINANMSATRIEATLVLLLFLSNLLADDPADFKIKTLHPNDRVEVKDGNQKTVFVIFSPKGISNAVFQRTAKAWPDRVTLQLKLKGLEHVKVSMDELKLEASVSSQTGEVRLWKAGQEDMPLDSKDPSWMEFRLLNSEGEPTKSIPLEEGCIEFQLPKKFQEINPESFKVEWIDFYRN